jgi:hypothetical protein
VCTLSNCEGLGTTCTACTLCRQMFANHRLAFAAAEMEVHEAKARLLAQNQLAAAQAQAAQRKLVSWPAAPSVSV